MPDPGQLELAEGTSPAAPAAGYRKLYPKADGWYEKDDAGVETKIQFPSDVAAAVTAHEAEVNPHPNYLNPHDIDVNIYEWDDFLFDSLGKMTATGAGAGNSTQSGAYGQDNVERALGISQTDTGTTATGRRTVHSQIGTITTGLAILHFIGRLSLEQLSSGAETFRTFIGFLNNTGAGEPNAGAYFRYTHSVNGGRWEAVTANGGGAPAYTVVDTGVLADNAYHIFDVRINENGTSAEFKIDGVVVATIVTNLPPTSIAANDTFAWAWKIEKSVGVTPVAISADYFFFSQHRTVAR